MIAYDKESAVNDLIIPFFGALATPKRHGRATAAHAAKAGGRSQRPQHSQAGLQMQCIRYVR
jgi:hypothetical protein